MLPQMTCIALTHAVNIYEYVGWNSFPPLKLCPVLPIMSACWGVPPYITLQSHVTQTEEFLAWHVHTTPWLGRVLVYIPWGVHSTCIISLHAHLTWKLIIAPLVESTYYRRRQYNYNISIKQTLWCGRGSTTSLSVQADFNLWISAQPIL